MSTYTLGRKDGACANPADFLKKVQLLRERDSVSKFLWVFKQTPAALWTMEDSSSPESPALGFGLADYAVFSVMLLVSMVIGLYQALKKPADSAAGAEDFFTGGRSLPAVPVGLSLCASFMSAIQVLGVPAESSRYGFKFLYMCLGQSINSLSQPCSFCQFLSSGHHQHQPVQFSEKSIKAVAKIELHLCYTCTVMYLRLRFGRGMQLLGSVQFLVATLLYTGIVIYAPALILNEGRHEGCYLDRCVPDFSHALRLCGHFHPRHRSGWRSGRVLEIAYNGSRINFNDFDADPRKRYTFWSLAVGGAMVWLSMYGVNQAQVQRYISCRTEKDAQWAIFVNQVGLCLIVSSAATCGIVMFAYYIDCDPLKSGKISSPDLHCLHEINAMAAVTLEDILRPHLTHIKQSNIVLVSKALSLFYGIGCISVAALSSFLDWGVLQGSFTVMGVVSGPLLGVFLLGMFVPAANKLGAFLGITVGYCVSLWLAVGSTLYPPSAETMGVLPTYTDHCASTNTSHSSSATWLQPKGGLHNFYSVSYLYFGAMATSSVVLTGLIVSYATGPTKRDQIKEGLLWWDLNKNKAEILSDPGTNRRTFPALLHNTQKRLHLPGKSREPMVEKTTQLSKKRSHQGKNPKDCTTVMLEPI
ncbi:hypothetical protein WMY93_025387 [Mugilogobius chulae]|uniref:Solute carrier family 5 member 5 n=1 Tax=Mugilogobius chulae TaxID=88201 RepID=A0AAW0NDD5_9GOBI